MPLPVGGVPDKGCKMTVGGQRANRTRDDQHRIMVQVRERDDLWPREQLPKYTAKTSGSVGSLIPGCPEEQTQMGELQKPP